MSLREIEDLGFSLQDNICVEMRICFGCGEYKGVINIVEAVGYYGKEVLPL